ncbi:MAG: RDD family protein [Pseudomonadota bacterium]
MTEIPQKPRDLHAPSFLIHVGLVLNLLLVGSFMALTFPTIRTVVTAITDWPISVPVVDFMGHYTPPERNGYWLLYGAVLVFYSALIGLSGRVLGASPGKALVGITLIDEDGARPSRAAFLKRSLTTAILVSLIMVPGPLLGFVFGPSANPYSVGLLMVALPGVYVLAAWRLINGRIWADWYAGLWPTRRNQADQMRAALEHDG